MLIETYPDRRQYKHCLVKYIKDHAKTIPEGKNVAGLFHPDSAWSDRRMHVRYSNQPQAHRAQTFCETGPAILITLDKVPVEYALPCPANDIYFLCRWKYLMQL